MHDKYMENDGQTVYFLMSQFGPYNVFLMEVVFQGNETGVVDQSLSAEIPRSCALHQNTPNPFNASTEIRYQIPEDCRVTLNVFNNLGHLVRTLVSKHQEAGQYAVLWEGRDAEGKELASGIYFCQLKAGDLHTMIKMALIK